MSHGVTAWLDLLDRRVKGARHLPLGPGETLLGVLPKMDHLSERERHTLLLGSSRPSEAEAFLNLGNAIKRRSKVDFPKSVLVTSGAQGDGKTFIACNLAALAAREGHTTLLVDLNFRRPRLHHVFDQNAAHGITAWHGAGGQLLDVMRGHPLLGVVKLRDHLSLLGAGAPPSDPAAVLQSPAFVHLLDALTREFDLIVLDGASTSDGADTRQLADHVDEIVYVCRSESSRRRRVRRDVHQLQLHQAELVGVVLNAAAERWVQDHSPENVYPSYKKYYGAEG